MHCMGVLKKYLLIMKSTTTKCFVIMEAECKELVRVGAIKLALSHTHCSFSTLPSENRQAFSCTTRLPESELAVV
jgi:hypothetical protein